MLEALPNIDWSAEEIIPALNLVLKRINTTFTKITDKPDLMVSNHSHEVKILRNRYTKTTGTR
jgi:hypothetical protein